MFKTGKPYRSGIVNPQTCHPEKKEPEDSLFDRLGSLTEWFFRHKWANASSGLQPLVRMIAEAGQGLAACSDDALRQKASELRPLLRRHGFRADLVAKSFAIIRETGGRTLGKRHFDSQMMGGWALLQGVVAEMATGEGKSLCATLPACTAAFASMPVHIVTVNDYLVSRDAEEMLPLYNFFNISVGAIIHGMDPSDRKQAYRCDITYCNNKELVFDYLKDRLVLGSSSSRAQLQIEGLYQSQGRADRLLQRGLHFAIVDETDSVLIDEARTPLIISSERDSRHEKEIYCQALDLAGLLEENCDFTIDPNDQSIRITDRGKQNLADMGETAGGIWLSPKTREELISLALSARIRYHKDRHYLIAEDKVQIIDEYTGRIMPDRSWEGGLHQMIEAKEGCDISKNRETIARITYQRFFRRYLLLSGMTGTASEVAKELWTVYELKTIRIPTNRPLRRHHYSPQIQPTTEGKWQAILAHVSKLHDEKRQPILVGTRSVEASEYLSRLFTESNLPHVVLNARQDQDEAEIVSHAGELGRITIATNMAGRGTDIKLAAGVADIGGLHVILTEYHDSRRVDRQLFGRCARQGDPGSCIAIVSIEDELTQSYYDRYPGTAKKALLFLRGLLGNRFNLWFIHTAQHSAEGRHTRIRRDTLKTDRRLDKMLAFTGRIE